MPHERHAKNQEHVSESICSITAKLSHGQHRSSASLANSVVCVLISVCVSAWAAGTCSNKLGMITQIDQQFVLPTYSLRSW